MVVVMPMVSPAMSKIESGLLAMNEQAPTPAPPAPASQPAPPAEPVLPEMPPKATESPPPGTPARPGPVVPGLA